MSAYQIVIGILILIADICIIVATLLNKKSGSGLSAAISGGSSYMNAKKNHGASVFLDRIVMWAACVDAALVVAAGIIAARL